VKPQGPAIPFPTPSFSGRLGRLLPDASPGEVSIPMPAHDAPNIVLVL